MNKGTFTSLAILLFVFASFTDASKKRKSVFTQISNNVSERGASYEKLQEVINLTKHRLTGSENGKKAETFAFDTFRAFGYSDVSYAPFEVESWSRNKVSLSIVPSNSDNFREVKVVSLAHSPKAAQVSAPIVDCFDGLASDFEKVKGELKGKVALFNINIQSENNKGQKNLHRSEKTALAIKHGAAGVMIANSVEGGVLLTGTASVTGSLISIPAVCISLESGKAIRAWIRDEHNLVAQIEMLNYNKPVRARNIVAKHKGQGKYSKGKIVIGGHLDSWDLAQGAVDNGLGAFSVLDIARVFKDLNLKTKRPIEFVLFMGEEQGLLGSKSYIEKAEKDGSIANVSLMMNLDMINNAHGFNAFGNEKLNKIFNSIGDEIQSIDKAYLNKNRNAAGLHSDHQAFMVKGIPVCSPVGKLSKAALNCYHADCDSMELIDKKELDNNVKYTAMMLYALANSNSLPKRKTSEETRDYLIAQNLKNELILGEEWLWDN
ncbi:M20/M25/M40 family metallo-hydrolase [Arcticibacterium luteifluviistationis]|uniref:Carboxypeptidase Q n=1 Tax=Arcticibacterium luteifluviistationis TaxID=1784714 RepID=A0A2Z4GFF2_9BACT|nr:M20/M25/M40 family metallo-hydrolase [Arcticibacterium luteifluviistationis]AWW00110.1 aminopeptidase [Arcticibacterium luteifluviistationis]